MNNSFATAYNVHQPSTVNRQPFLVLLLLALTLSAKSQDSPSVKTQIDKTSILIGEQVRLGIDVRREYADVPPIEVDRHKLLQILLNLLSNARHALVDSGTPEKRLTIRVAPDPEEKLLRIEVEDNGVGIPREHLTRLFAQGFTTKQSGHGFGLHISALAAQELSPHHVAFWLRDCASDFHAWYNAERVLVDDPALKLARLRLAATTRQVLANGLQLLGVSAPERM